MTRSQPGATAWAATPDFTERNAEIIRRAKAGQSRGRIGRDMGLTKNQVVGVCHRAKVGDAAAEARQTVVTAPAAHDASARKGPTCQWIEGNPKRGEPVVFCGEPIQPGSSYCCPHWVRAYVPRSRSA